MTPATPLPPLRELDLLPGPALPDGQPSWTLHDPVRNLFFQIDWASFEILQRWRLRWPGVIARRIQAETTLRAEPDDVEAMHRFLAQHELLQPAALTAAELAGQRQRRRAGWSQWLLHICSSACRCCAGPLVDALDAKAGLPVRAGLPLADAPRCWPECGACRVPGTLSPPRWWTC